MGEEFFETYFMEILKKYWKFILAYGLLVIVLILLLYYYREVYELVREMIRFFSKPEAVERLYRRR